MKKFTLIIASTLFLVSCGPSREEIEANIRRGQEMADSIAAEIKREAEIQDSLKMLLVNLKGELAGAEQKLESIKGFQLLRTQDEKASQVAGQTTIIEELKMQIDEVSKQIK